MSGSQVLVVLLLCTIANSQQSDLIPIKREDKGDEIRYRLPTNALVLEYNLHLTTNVQTQKDRSFTGIVEIKIMPNYDTDFITFHHRNLTINSITIASDKTRTYLFELLPFDYDPGTEFLTVELIADSDPLLKGQEYIITISYSGFLSLNHLGFYLSTYNKNDGTSRLASTTHFNPTHARETFPCFDEPYFPAKIQFNITHSSGYYALSNMPAGNTVAGENNMTTTYFPMTKFTMPVYLFCFIVSDFPFTSKKNGNGLVQRAFARPDAIHKVELALNISAKLLDELEKDFGAFQLPKLDHVAMNFAAFEDLDVGAMENWGLIIYREDQLMYDENDSIHRIENITRVVAHELIHQWFGNQVTPRWWSYLWLSEGFAHWLQYYYTDVVFPEWNYMDRLLAKIQHTMPFDSTNSFIRPIAYYVEKTSSIRPLFDGITHAKSGAMLHMFSNAFQKKCFFKGLNIYLKSRTNLAADENDIYEALEDTVNANHTLPNNASVASIISSWSRQSGFPLVTVKRNYETGDVVLLQKRHYADATMSEKKPSLWWIPYSFVTASYRSTTISWFNVRNATVAKMKGGESEWFLLNQYHSGYYRVQYDLKNYELLSKALVKDHKSIHKTVRSQLLDDAFSFAASGRVSYSVVFGLMKYLRREVEYSSWEPVFRGLEEVDRMFAGNEAYALFTKYMKHLLCSFYHTTESNAHESPFQTDARNNAIRWSCRWGHVACLEETNSKLNQWLLKRITLRKEFEASILSNGMRSANQNQFDQMLERLTAENELVQRSQLIEYLAHSGQEKMLDMYLNSTIEKDSKILRSAWERYQVFVNVVKASHLGAEKGVTFLKNNFETTMELYGTSHASACLTEISRYVAWGYYANEFSDLLKQVSNVLSEQDQNHIAVSSAIVTKNQEWIELHSRDIQQWLQTNTRTYQPNYWLLSILIILIVLLVILVCISLK